MKSRILADARSTPVYTRKITRVTFESEMVESDAKVNVMP
jgi:hypothetical protein